MLVAEHPELLAPDWVPPFLAARSAALDRLGRWLLEPESGRPAERTVRVLGPAGSGTSAVARRAALNVIESLRRTEPGVRPVFAPVRVRWSHGTVDVASELVRSLDPEFEGRGFPIVEILAGFLRRLERSRRPAVVVLDDLGPDVPDIGPVVRALRSPIRFLPEGIDDPPRVWLLLAGRSEPSYCWQRADRAGAPIERTVLLPPYTDREIREIVGDRARRALGREAPPGTVERIVDRAIDGGLGLPKAIDLLRQAILGPERLRPGSPYRPPSARSAALVEPRLLLALRKATERGPAELRQLRAWEAKFAQEAGLRPLPTTTLWRRIVRLEAAGIVRRSVRTGGNGGTRSSLELVRPIGPSEMITALPDNPRAVETAGPMAPA